MVLADMPQDDKKNKMMVGLGAKLAEDGLEKDKDFQASTIFFVSEAWMRTAEKDEDLTKVPVRDHPDKREAMIVTGLTIDGRSNMATIEINRDKKGNIILGKVNTNYYKRKEGKEEDVQNNLLGNFWYGYTNSYIAKFGGKPPTGKVHVS